MRRHLRAWAVLTVLLFVGATASVFAEQPVIHLVDHPRPVKFALRSPGPQVKIPTPPKEDKEGEFAVPRDGAMPRSGSLGGVQTIGGFAASSTYEITSRSIRTLIRKLG